MCSRVAKYKFSPLLGKLFTFGPIRPSQSYLVLNLLESSFFPSTASDVFALLSLPVSIAASSSIQSAPEIAARGKGIIRSETNAVKISSYFSIPANVYGVMFLVTRGFSRFFGSSEFFWEAFVGFECVV